MTIKEEIRETTIKSMKRALDLTQGTDFAAITDRPGIVTVGHDPLAWLQGHRRIWPGNRRNEDRPELGATWFLMVDIDTDTDADIEKAAELLARITEVYAEIYDPKEAA